MRYVMMISQDTVSYGKSHIICRVGREFQTECNRIRREKDGAQKNFPGKFSIDISTEVYYYKNRKTNISSHGGKVMAKEDKLKALDAAISQIEKQYGKGCIMKLGDNSAHMNVETIES